MVDYESITAIIFIILLTILIYKKRKNLDTKHFLNDFFNFSLYKTTWGLKLMDKISSKFPKTIKWTGYIGIVVGFVGMIAICYALVLNAFDLISKPETAAGAGLVLPIKAPGIFFVPFSYWIISIFVLATVHEFSHGLIARAHNIKVKSSGLAFIGSSLKGIGIIAIFLSIILKIRRFDFNFVEAYSSIDLSFFSFDFWLITGIVLYLISKKYNLFVPIIPAAFVEPDEKMLRKRPHKEQLSVFAAGPFANVITAIIFLVIILAMTPFVSSLVDLNGVEIVKYAEGNQTFPIENAKIGIGEVVQEIDGTKIITFENLSDVMKTKRPGQNIIIVTDRSEYKIKLAKNPDNESLAYMGAHFDQSRDINEKAKNKFGSFIPNFIIWVFLLFTWIHILNLGIGLFNLVPAGPLDGGRMLQLPLQRIFGKDRGNKVWSYIGLGLFFIIFFIIATGLGLLNFISDLLSFLFTGKV